MTDAGFVVKARSTGLQMTIFSIIAGDKKNGRYFISPEGSVTASGENGNRNNPSLLRTGRRWMRAIYCYYIVRCKISS